MTGRKKKDKDEGVKIPIEGADEATEAAEAPEETVEEEVAPADESAAEAAKAAEATEATEAADDLIAEAEAIVEEASAADQLEAARAEATEWQDRYMRLHAEWDTYRRRTNEQRAEEKVRATEKLMEDLWETDCYVDENTLSVNVARLRKTLESIGLKDIIKTKFGVGYCLAEEA